MNCGNFNTYSTNMKLLYNHIPIITGVLGFPTPTTFLAATVTVYSCTWELVTLNVC